MGIENGQYAACKLPKVLDLRSTRKFSTLMTEAVRAIHGRSQLMLYAPTLLHDIDFWANKLRDPGFHCWICVAPNAKTGALTIEQGQWVAIYTIRGPVSAVEYNFFEDESMQPVDEASETYWAGGRLYVKEQHRSPTVLTTLHHAAMAFLERETKEHLEQASRMSANKSFQVRIRFTASYGIPAYEIYKTSGARVVRELTRTQTLDLAGLLQDIPAEFLSNEDWRTPVISLFETVHEVPIL